MLSGHSATDLGFLAVPVFLLRVSPAWAKRLLALVVIAGLWTGFTQVYRGAHYVSHSLWTAWISFSIASIVWLMLRRTATAQLSSNRL